MDVSQYLEIFIDETKEHLQTLSDQLMILETEPDNMETINEIFRAAHSLKGMAGTMGYKRMQRLTHDMENVFQEIRSGNMKVQPELIDVLFRGLDALEGYLANILESADEGTEDNEEIINTLNSIADKAKGGTGEVPVPTPTAAPSDDKSAASDGNKAKYENIRISDYEKATFEKAKEENLNILGITVYLQDSCILKAARAFLVFKCLEELGEVMKAEPNVQDNTDIEYRKALCGPTYLGPSTKYFNAYALANAEAIYDGQRSVNPDDRVFLLTRSGFAGHNAAQPHYKHHLCHVQQQRAAARNRSEHARNVGRARVFAAALPNIALQNILGNNNSRIDRAYNIAQHCGRNMQ